MVQKYHDIDLMRQVDARTFCVSAISKPVPLYETQGTYVHTHFALSLVAAARACTSKAYLPIAAAPAAI